MVPPSEEKASLMVAVRVRPLLETEQAKGDRKDILRVMNGKVVLVLDPDESKDYLDQMANRTKEKRYTFDLAFDSQANNRNIYDGTIHELVAGVMNGLNGTVFAYGATGSGKTYTMVGSPRDPGLMVLALERIFRDKAALYTDEQLEVTCSYLEVYNEVIYDLLVRNSGPLELREDPQQGVQVAGLKRITVKSAEEIMSLLEDGNRRRKTESTNANAVSSRSHAVLEIVVRRMAKNHYRKKQLCGKLSMVDLAGSERAAETNNHGHKLRDGANINRSLLALANCINALGKQKKRGMAYVPYRNSKLTRLLKDGLSGNSRTAMIATVAAASSQYHHSINTLKYADRAKEIKTHLVQNVGTVESHIADYQRIIDNLQSEVQNLKSQLDDKPTSQSAPGTNEDQLTWIDSLACEINENVEERINLQKALFELEDLNVCNKFELKNLDELIASGILGSEEEAAARDRRQNILESIRENEEAGLKYRADIEANEEARRSIQSRIDDGMGQNNNASFLKILSTFRLQAVRLQELQFQMAIRDQIISEQRSVISNLWNVLEASGLDKDSILDIAQQQGIFMDGFMPEEDGPPTVGASQLTGVCGVERQNSLTLLQGAVNKQSMAGERAKYRYCFWSKYDASTTSESAVDLEFDRPRSASREKRGLIRGGSTLPSTPEEDSRRFDGFPSNQHREGPRMVGDVGRPSARQDAMFGRQACSVSSSDSDRSPLPSRPPPSSHRSNPGSFQSHSNRVAPRRRGLLDRRARASDGDDMGEGVSGRGARKQDDEMFLLEGAGLVVSQKGLQGPMETESNVEDRGMKPPSEVDQKLRKLKGRLLRKMMAPSPRKETPDNNGDQSATPVLEVNSQQIRPNQQQRRHSDSGTPSRDGDYQRDRRRAQLQLLKKMGRERSIQSGRARV